MIHDLIIIGAGPAGITAGIYAARQKLKTLLIAKDLGGQVAKKAVDIENYPGFEKIPGQDLIKKFEEHLKNQEVQIERDEVVKIEKQDKGFLVLTKDNNQFEAKAVIVASGADPKTLNVPGEEDFIGRGVSYCSLCDGPIFRNKIVAVIGGGNAGFESAVFLSNYVQKIYILEQGSQVKADQSNQDLIKKSGKAEIITNAAVKGIKGDKFVEFLSYQDLNSNEIKNLEVAGVFIEIGYKPAVSFVRDLVDFNEKSEIKVAAETQQTRTPGLFAAGDVNVGQYKQIITACGEGAKAALSAYEYIVNNQ